jgi:hypothetical protein
MIPPLLLFPYHYEVLTFNTAAPQAVIRPAQDLGKPYGLLRYDECWNSTVLELDESSYPKVV